MFKRRPQDFIKVEIEGATFTFRYPTYPEIARIQAAKDKGEMFDVIISTCVSIQNAKMDNGVEVNTRNIYDLDMTVIEQIFAGWITERDKVKARRDADAANSAEEKKSETVS